jgi:hypothetical protein
VAAVAKAAFPICLSAVAVAKACGRRVSRAHPGLSTADRFDDGVAGGAGGRTLLGSAFLLKREIQSFGETTECESRTPQRDILFSEPGEFLGAM